MKLISIHRDGFLYTTVIVEKNNVVYCVQIGGYSDSKNAVYEMYREHKVRKDSKLHSEMCAFAERHMLAA
jgi:hypothetical protein